MKNNTKLIMETWRRFLKEGLEGIDEDGMVRDESEEEVNASDLPPVEDSELALAGDLETIDSMRGEPFDDEYNPDGDKIGQMDDMDDLHKFDPYGSSPTDNGDDYDDDYETNDPEEDEYYEKFGRPKNPGDNTLIPTSDPDDSLDM